MMRFLLIQLIICTVKCLLVIGLDASPLKAKQATLNDVAIDKRCSVLHE